MINGLTLTATTLSLDKYFFISLVNVVSKFKSL